MNAMDMITDCMTRSYDSGSASTGRDEIETASKEVREWLMDKKLVAPIPEEPMGNGGIAP